MAVGERLEQLARPVGGRLHLTCVNFHTCVYTNVRIFCQASMRAACVAPGLPAVASEMEDEMNVDRAVLAFAGAMVLVSLLLALTVSPYWLLLTAFAGANMVQAAFTGFCPAAIVFRKLGLGQGCAFS